MREAEKALNKIQTQCSLSMELIYHYVHQLVANICLFLVLFREKKT